MRNLLCLAFVSLLPACDAAYGDDHESSGSAGSTVLEFERGLDGNYCTDDFPATSCCPDGYSHVGWSTRGQGQDHAVCLED
jgi:hypothetical protein